LSFGARLVPVALFGALALLGARSALAQVGQPGPPGPFVVDLRGVTGGLPTGAAYYPAIITEDVVVPARGFGADLGAHVYPLTIAGLRVGLGAEVVYTRGATAGEMLTDAGEREVVRSEAGLLAVAPQLSVNFGTSDGWSYLSAGYGAARLRTRLERQDAAETLTSGWTGSINAGGGARWFIRPRLAVGFDVRLHRLSASAGGPPGLIVTSVAAGVSIR
jgi:hypothetical protein